MLKMLIVRHLGTPNSSFPLASLNVIECVIQYYKDQCSGEDIIYISLGLYCVFVFISGSI